MRKTRRVRITVRLAVAGSIGVMALGAAVLFQQRAAAEPTHISASHGNVVAAIVFAGTPNPSKVMGPGNDNSGCGGCHKLAYAAWTGSPHSKSLDVLKDSPEAKQIAIAMGIKGPITRKQNTCWDCHITSQAKEDGPPQPMGGVSCESCHGAASDWIDIHNDRGGHGNADEPAEHRAERWRKSDEKGMIRKDRVYLIAENCFSCHTVPNEDLVNTGHHKAGSDFELVAWSQGVIRHNFLENDGTNRVNTPQRLRVMYVVGKLVELEVTLRNLAAAKSDGGEYFKFMAERANRVLSDLAAVQKAVTIAEVAEALAAVPCNAAGKMKVAGTADVAPLSEASAKVKAASRKFADSNDGSKLEAIDPLLPKPESYKGQAYKP